MQRNTIWNLQKGEVNKTMNKVSMCDKYLPREKKYLIQRRFEPLWWCKSKKIDPKRLPSLDLFNTLRSIAYASRALTAVQRNYAQIEKEAMTLFFGCLKSHFFFMVEYDHKPFKPFFGSHNLQSPYIYRDNFLSSTKTTNWCLLVMLWVAIIFMISFLVLMRLDLQAYIKAHECLESNQWNTPVLCDRFYKIHMFKIEFQSNQTRCNHPMFNVILVVYCTEKIIGKHSDQMDARSPRTQLSLKFDRYFEVCSHNEGITGVFFGFFGCLGVLWEYIFKIWRHHHYRWWTYILDTHCH